MFRRCSLGNLATTQRVEVIVAVLDDPVDTIGNPLPKVTHMPRQSALKTIRQQIAKLEAQAKKLAEGEEDKKRKAIADVTALMRKLGLTIEDLSAAPARTARKSSAGPAKEKKKVSKPVPVKFRNAETGDTWSGRGRTPRWLVAAEAAGRTRDEFKVD